MKILIVDDTLSKVSEVRTILVGTEAGCSIDVANTGLSARERLAATQYDLPILDIKLPCATATSRTARAG